MSDPGTPRPVTSSGFAAALAAAGQPVLVDFWASWCGPCRMMQPVLADYAARQAGRLTVLTVDVEAESALATQHGVQSIPTLILFVDGQPVQRLVGAQLGGRLDAALAPWLGP